MSQEFGDVPTQFRVNPKKRSLRQYTALFFILPALVFYIIFLVIPIMGTLRYSFFNWDGASPTMQFVGLGNYIQLIHDALFWESLGHNLFWIVSTIAIPVFLGLILASMLSMKWIKGRTIFRVTYFIPSVVSLVAVGIIWDWIYDPQYGILNAVLRTIGLSVLQAPWLGDASTVLPALIVAGSWTYYGFCMVIFLAALQGIDPAFFEAARMEGASSFQTFIHITVPLLKNAITLVVLNSLIGSFKVFDIIYVMTKGGPFHSSEVVSTYMYTNAFEMNRVGYGAAISIFLALIIAFASILYIRFAERD